MSKVTGRFACTTKAVSPMLNTYYQGPVLTTQNCVYFAKKSVNAKPFLVRTTFCTHQNFCKRNETSKIPSTSFGGCKNFEVRKSFVPWHSFVIGSSNFATYGLWSERDRMTSRECSLSEHQEPWSKSSNYSTHSHISTEQDLRKMALKRCRWISNQDSTGRANVPAGVKRRTPNAERRMHCLLAVSFTCVCLRLAFICWKGPSTMKCCPFQEIKANRKQTQVKVTASKQCIRRSAFYPCRKYPVRVKTTAMAASS